MLRRQLKFFRVFTFGNTFQIFFKNLNISEIIWIRLLERVNLVGFHQHRINRTSLLISASTLSNNSVPPLGSLYGLTLTLAALLSYSIKKYFARS